MTSIIVPDPNNPKFHFTLDPWYDQNLQLCFEAKFIRPGLDSDIYSTCTDPVIIYHPKPVVTAIEFFNFEPVQLANCLNEPKEIYNPEVKLGLRVYYNDYLSNNDTIKLALHYTKSVVLDTILYFTDETVEQAPGIPPYIEFDNNLIGSFNLGPVDFDTTKFRAYAWFEEPFTEPEDHKASDDSLTLVYRVNTKPKLVITTLYDTIFTNNNLKIKGVVIDTTGYLDKVELKLDGAINVTNDIVQVNDSTFTWEYTGTFLENPINNFQITAFDAVDFYPEGSDTSEIRNTRIIYAFFDDANPDEYLPKDSSFRIFAIPPGGIFTSIAPNIIDSSGFINPGKMLPGEYAISYKFATKTDSKTLTKDILVRQPCEILYSDPDQVFWVNSSDWYWIHCNNEDSLVSWLPTGGEIIENMGDSVYVEWTQGSAGDFQTKISAIIAKKGFNYTYSLDQLVAVDNGFAPLKAQIMMEGNANNGYMLFSSVTDTLNYSYEWFKNDDSVNPGWSRPYIFIGSTDIQGTYHVIITDRFSGSYTKSAYYNVSLNNAVKPAEMKENGSHSINQ
jgi:hypothetical protein